MSTKSIQPDQSENFPPIPELANGSFHADSFREINEASTALKIEKEAVIEVRDQVLMEFAEVLFKLPTGQFHGFVRVRNQMGKKVLAIVWNHINERNTLNTSYYDAETAEHIGNAVEA